MAINVRPWRDIRARRLTAERLAQLDREIDGRVLTISLATALAESGRAPIFDDGDPHAVGEGDV